MTMKKFSSRKFLISLAAFLGSIGASISGIVTDNETVTIIGAVCTVLSGLSMRLVKRMLTEKQ